MAAYPSEWISLAVKLLDFCKPDSLCCGIMWNANSAEVLGQMIHSMMSGEAQTTPGIFQQMNFVVSLLCFNI